VVAARVHVALLAIVAGVTVPILMADLHTHDMVKATARALSGRQRTLERDDLRSYSPPIKRHQ